ncbi:hypothetical protein QYF36_009300 [Acer negundo]|nr:hypothetical protein QYF36_009300 [Acer negundo]
MPPIRRLKAQNCSFSTKNEGCQVLIPACLTPVRRNQARMLPPTIQALATRVTFFGWRQFVTTAYQINERLVREFYATMDPKEFEKGTPVNVRVVDVWFSAQDINTYYGT